MVSEGETGEAYYLEGCFLLHWEQFFAGNFSDTDELYSTDFVRCVPGKVSTRLARRIGCRAVTRRIRKCPFEACLSARNVTLAVCICEAFFIRYERA